MALVDVARSAGIPLEAVEVTAKWEGCLKKHKGLDLYDPYLCPARVPTIGLGTTVYNEVGRRVSMKDPPITRAKAEELLAYDLGKKYAPAVRRAAKFKTQNQYAACISFAYNVGTAGFSRSTMCWLINQGRYEDAAKEFARWTRGGGRVLPGLVNRRRDERALFLRHGAAYGDAMPAPVQSLPPPAAAARPWWKFW